MNNPYTDKVGRASTGTSDIGKTPALTFKAIMNLLIKVLIRLGLLTKDLDYHLVRASMVISIFFFGYQKWFAYEAHDLIPFSRMVLSSLGCTLFSASGRQLVFRGIRMVVWRASVLGILE